MDFYGDGDGQLRSSTPIRARSQRSLNEPNGAGSCNGNNGMKNGAHNTHSPRDQSYHQNYYTTNNNLTTGSRRSNVHINRSPNQHQNNTYATHSHIENNTFIADTSTYSPADLRKQVDELQRKLSEMSLEHELLQFDLSQARAENDQLHRTIREKDMAHEKLRKQSETVIQTTYTLYEKLRQFKVRYYQEKNGNFLFNDPSPGEDG